MTRARTRTALSGDKSTDHEATAPPNEYELGSTGISRGKGMYIFWNYTFLLTGICFLWARDISNLNYQLLYWCTTCGSTKISILCQNGSRRSDSFNNQSSVHVWDQSWKPALQGIKKSAKRDIKVNTQATCIIVWKTMKCVHDLNCQVKLWEKASDNDDVKRFITCCTLTELSKSTNHPFQQQHFVLQHLICIVQIIKWIKLLVKEQSVWVSYMVQ